MEIFMKLKFLLFLLLICMVFSSCTPKQEAEPSSTLSVSDTAITFTDALDRAVTVDSPKRVAATLGSFAQIWMLAGGSVCATADDAWEDLQLELPADTVNLGNTKQLSPSSFLQANRTLSWQAPIPARIWNGKTSLTRQISQLPTSMFQTLMTI